MAGDAASRSGPAADTCEMRKLGPTSRSAFCAASLRRATRPVVKAALAPWPSMLRAQLEMRRRPEPETTDNATPSLIAGSETKSIDRWRVVIFLAPGRASLPDIMGSISALLQRNWQSSATAG